MRVIRYEAWRSQELAERLPNEKFTCYACKGTKEVHCDCGCQHCEHYNACDICDSNGMVVWGDLKKKDKEAILTKDDYFKALRSDIELVAKYKGVDPCKIAMSYGFSSVCLIDSGKKGGDGLFMEFPLGSIIALRFAKLW